MVESIRAGGIGRSAPITRDGAKTAGAPFSVDDGAAPLTQKARLSSVAGIGLESMLALQAVDEGAERDRKARKRGTAMIAALRNLQRAMLREEEMLPALHALNELAIDNSPAAGGRDGDSSTGDLQAHDPALGAILRQIILRSRIEVARRERREA